MPGDTAALIWAGLNVSLRASRLKSKHREPFYLLQERKMHLRFQIRASKGFTNMASEALSFFDIAALVIVLAGTLLATMARCGWRDMSTAIKAMCGLFVSGFDEGVNRSALARCAPQIRRRGHLCADTPVPPDASLAKLVEAYLISGSIDALWITARAERAKREITRAQAMRVYDHAGELAPIFGLVGTLFAITQLVPTASESAAGAVMGAVSTAVLSTLYGVLTAHLICAPLSGAIERRGLREETAREELIDWFERQLTGQDARKLMKIKDAA